nr:MAG TPA: hypothetical protein [Caudoviricetes sp.]
MSLKYLHTLNCSLLAFLLSYLNPYTYLPSSCTLCKLCFYNNSLLSYCQYCYASFFVKLYILLAPC